MNFQSPKRKRGRPRKNSVGFGTLLNGSKTMEQDTNALNNNSPVPNTDESKNLENVEIEDWECEIEGRSNQVNLPVLQFNNSLENSNLKVENKQEPVDSNLIYLEDILIDVSSLGVEQGISLDTNGLFTRVDEKLKPPTKIHIIDGEKGGAGKSFVSRALIEYCKLNGLDVAIVDADNSNQDIAKLYPGVESAFFSDDEKQAKYADKIFYLALEKTVIVNLPAQVYTNVTNWIQRNKLVELGKENSISFIKWFVCTGSIDSVNFFLQSLNDLGNDVKHVFVRNMGLCDDWKYIEEMPEFVDAQTKYKFAIMDFPKFPFWERNTIDRLGTTFNQALRHPELKVVSRQRVKNFLTEAYRAFNYMDLV